MTNTEKPSPATDLVLDPDADKFTGKFVTNVAPPERLDPIMVALELSELARILGGDQPPRPPNSHHTIFLL